MNCKKFKIEPCYSCRHFPEENVCLFFEIAKTLEHSLKDDPMSKALGELLLMFQGPGKSSPIAQEELIRSMKIYLKLKHPAHLKTLDKLLLLL